MRRSRLLTLVAALALTLSACGSSGADDSGSPGGDAHGVLPWIREELEANGEEVPTLLSETEEPPYEEIAAAEPDEAEQVLDDIDAEVAAAAKKQPELAGKTVAALANRDSTFLYTLSYEQLDKPTSDVLVIYAATQEQADRFLASKPAQAMQQVKKDNVAQVVGAGFVASVSPPTALSLTWGLDEYVGLLSDAVADAG